MQGMPAALLIGCGLWAAAGAWWFDSDRLGAVAVVFLVGGLVFAVYVRYTDIDDR